MPTSKRPRKKHKQKRIALPCIKRKDINFMRRVFRNVELAARLKLHRGECSFSDLEDIRDVLNCTVFSFMHRQAAFDQKEIDAALELINDAGQKLTEVLLRGRERNRYVCTADQLTAILSAMELCDDFVSDSLNICPFQMFDEFNGSLLIRDALPPEGSFSCSRKIVDFAFSEARQINRLSDAVFHKARLNVIKQLQKMMRQKNEKRTAKEIRNPKKLLHHARFDGNVSGLPFQH